MEQIFIVEDDEKLRTELMFLLERNGYECKAITNFQNVIEEIISTHPHLVLLDINLPIYDGYYICKKVRSVSSVPIITITSNNNDMDELEMLSSGADDFIVKPFNPRILLAHIAAVLKRVYGCSKNLVLSHNEAVLDVLKSKVSHNDEVIELTKNELLILKLLIENKGNIIPRSEIISTLWDAEEFVEDNTLTVNINRLRKKLESIGLQEYIITKRGQGYIV